jgi:beta-galactosidase beta subunit
LKVADPYVEEKDIEFLYLGKNLTYLTVPQGSFAIFWPGDAHMRADKMANRKML